MKKPGLLRNVFGALSRRPAPPSPRASEVIYDETAGAHIEVFADNADVFDCRLHSEHGEPSRHIRDRRAWHTNDA